MSDATKMPEPVAWLVCGGRTFVDRGFTSEDGARESVARRNDGARIEPLYTATQVQALLLASREEALKHLDFCVEVAIRDAYEKAAMACERIHTEYRDAYKGRGDEIKRDQLYNPHTDGCSDGAFECAEALRALSKGNQ